VQISRPEFRIHQPLRLPTGKKVQQTLNYFFSSLARGLNGYAGVTIGQTHLNIVRRVRLNLQAMVGELPVIPISPPVGLLFKLFVFRVTDLLSLRRSEKVCINRHSLLLWNNLLFRSLI
jgi:hypothetical protein